MQDVMLHIAWFMDKNSRTVISSREYKGREHYGIFMPPYEASCSIA